MSTNICRAVRREIDQSELGESLSDKSKAHIALCASCGTFRDERLQLRELVGGLRPVSAPADFDMRLRARIARERETPRQPFIFRLVMSTPAIVVAAVLVIAVAAVVFYTQMNRRQNNQLALGESGQPLKPAANTVATQTVPQPPPAVSPNDGDSKPKQAMVAQRNPMRITPVSLPPMATDYGVKAAQPVRMVERAGEVSLNTPSRPLVVTMYDEHGAARKIELPPISFGSQRLTDNRKQVSLTNMKDW